MNHRLPALLTPLASVVSAASLLSTLVACEGEPPKMPATPAAVGPAPAALPSEEEPAAAPSEVAAPAALPPCACNCGCAGVASVPSPDGGASGEGGAAATAAAAAPAPIVAAATIAGSVTTVPKSAAASAVVYLEDAPVDPAAKMSASITNRMMTFSPFVAVVPVGGKAIFRNEDPFPHNVFSADNEKFNMGIIPPRAAAVRVMKSAGTYTLLCNLHPGMLGYLVVSPSSYFAKADAQGRFAIKNVPPGTYKATAWAPRQQPVTQSVTVKDGDASINFELHR
jgi:plastocyanin